MNANANKFQSAVHPKTEAAGIRSPNKVVNFADNKSIASGQEANHVAIKKSEAAPDTEGGLYSPVPEGTEMTGGWLKK